MVDLFSEPFLHLAGLTHNSALIAWGAFFFRVKDAGKKIELADDDDLKHARPPRRESVGVRSEPYGDATVKVSDAAGNVVVTASTSVANHCWVSGLKPDTEYSYRVEVNGEEWAHGERRDWVGDDDDGRLDLPKKSYRNRFRTFPDPAQPPRPFTFAVLGDFGVGIRKEKETRRQRRIAEALEKAVDEHDVRLILTTGDNIYRSGGFLKVIGGETGDEDDDWYFTFYQPYRYVINRVPAYPTVGNHDTPETEGKDDRSQVVDNFYLNEIASGAMDASSLSPGLFYRFRFGSGAEFICLDTSKESRLSKERVFTHPHHQDFLNSALPKANGEPRWRIPFCHHPPFCAGPDHPNTKGMNDLVRRFEEAGVRVVLSGHEHQFQHSRLNGVNYIVSGASGKVNTGTPKKFAKAHTVSWAAACHFLLVKVDGNQMTIRPVGELRDGKLADIERLAPDGSAVAGPIVVNLA
jgi:hypothetical protein